ncbi:MAG: LysE family transporter [Chloroflexi bacterium]|nr:LysE family transporter [Chloroflexota bacterium]
MSEGLSLLLFLLSVAVVSLSGVMMPGPVTAVIVSKGHQDSKAGVWIALGHGAIELPLMAAIYLGIGSVFTLPAVHLSISFAGGAMMLYLAWQMLRSLRQASAEAGVLPYNSVLAGLMTTAANPGFFLWWATIGIALVLKARTFGFAGIVSMAITHWACDFGWNWLVSWSVFRSRRLWSRRVREIVFTGFGLLLAGFGIWFIYTGVSAITG